MILGIATSVNDVPVRLTDERWYHIVDSHPEMTSLREAVLDAVENPDYILQSRRGAFAAVVLLGKPGMASRFLRREEHTRWIYSLRAN